MTNEELVEQVQAGIDTAHNMEQLYLQNRNFIYQVAKKYSSKAEMDDLLQEGYLGLYEAVKRYEFDKGTKFLSYAAYWIEQVIKRYVDNNGRSKRIPVYMQERISAYKKYIAACHSTGKEPTEAEICKALEITEKQLADLRRALREMNSVSIDDYIGGADGLTFEETIADPVNLEEETVEQMAEEHFEKIIWKIVDELGDIKSKVISGQYRYSKSLEKLADELHLSRGRIQQIRNSALRILSQKEQIQEAASFYGCDYSRGYKGGLSSFKYHGSSVENIALRRIEQEEKIAHLKREIREDEKIIKQSLNIDELFSNVLNFASQKDGESSAAET